MSPCLFFFLFFSFKKKFVLLDRSLFYHDIPVLMPIQIQRTHIENGVTVCDS